MCYCFICDAPVSDCGQWINHCTATNTPHFQNIRKKFALAQTQIRESQVERDSSAPRSDLEINILAVKSWPRWDLPPQPTKFAQPNQSSIKSWIFKR